MIIDAGYHISVVHISIPRNPVIICLKDLESDVDVEKVLEVDPSEVDVTDKVPKGIVEKELVEKMKSFDSLNKALQSLSDATDKIVDERCDNSISGFDKCKENSNIDADSTSSDSWMSSVFKMFG